MSIEKWNWICMFFVTNVGKNFSNAHKSWWRHYWNTYLLLVVIEQAGSIPSGFGGINKSILSASVTDIAILAPMNEDSLKIINDIMEMLLGHYTEYCNIDEVTLDDEHKAHQFQ